MFLIPYLNSPANQKDFRKAGTWNHCSQHDGWPVKALNEQSMCKYIDISFYSRFGWESKIYYCQSPGWTVDKMTNVMNELPPNSVYPSSCLPLFETPTAWISQVLENQVVSTLADAWWKIKYFKAIKHRWFLINLESI